MKFLKLLVIIVCLFGVYWGYHLIFNTYINANIYQFKLKTGDLNITKELVEHYSLQVNKTLFVQLGLMVVSVVFATLTITSFLRK